MAKSSRLPAAEPHRFISVRGAREHNLKNVDLDLPRDQLVVITGLSGSGKSSLAFDTIYAEGQRRYVESLSAYARQFLELMQKPDVDSIEGLSPAISIEQKTTSRNPRSTVGTVTEIYDYLRLLFARVGIPYSPATGLPIESQTVSQMVDRVMAMPEGTRLYLLAPIVRGRKGEYRKELPELQKKGFQRVKIDGKLYEIAEAPALDKKYKHDIDVVVDRIVVKRRHRQPAGRLASRPRSTSPRASRCAENADTGERTVFSVALRLPGLGLHHRGDRAAAVLLQRAAGRLPGLRRAGREDVLRSGAGGAGRPPVAAPRARSRRGPTRRASITMQTLESIARHFKVKMSTPWQRPAEEGARRRSCTAAAASRSPCATTTASAQYQTTKPFEGVIPNLDRRWQETDSSWVREELERFQHEAKCETCNGARLKPEALAVKIAGLNISQVTEFSIGDAVEWFLRARSQADAQAARDRRPHPEGDQRAAGLPRQCRARLPDPEPHLGHAVGRREPAHPAGLADRLRPDRRALRAGRAVDRPAPARQRPAAGDADAAARPRQHRAGGRA